MARSVYFRTVLLYIVATYYLTNWTEANGPGVFDGACYDRMIRCYFPVVDNYRNGQYSSPFEDSCYARCKTLGYKYGYCRRYPKLCKDPGRPWLCFCRNDKMYKE